MKAVFRTFKHNKITASSYLLLAVYFLSSACSSNKPEEIKAITNREDIPSLMYEELEMTFTDSGRVDSRITSPEVYVYDKKDDPIMDFPKGLHVIRYTNGEVEAQIKCLKAVYYTDKKYWELNHDVEAINEKGELLNTEQLFWDTKEKRIYSDKFVKITRGSTIIMGKNGFEADEKMKNIVIKEIIDSEIEMLE